MRTIYRLVLTRPKFQLKFICFVVVRVGGAYLRYKLAAYKTTESKLRSYFSIFDIFEVSAFKFTNFCGRYSGRAACGR